MTHRRAFPKSEDDGGSNEHLGRGPPTPRWVTAFGIAALVAAALFAAMHLMGDGIGRHMHMSTAEGWSVVAAVRAGNTRTDSAHNRYQIAPIELVKIQREATRQGLDIAGFYHSHTDHPAQWSATDFAEAHWIGCSYVITEIVHGKAQTTNSFLLAGTTEEDKRFEPETILFSE